MTRYEEMAYKVNHFDEMAYKASSYDKIVKDYNDIASEVETLRNEKAADATRIETLEAQLAAALAENDDLKNK